MPFHLKAANYPISSSDNDSWRIQSNLSPAIDTDHILAQEVVKIILEYRRSFSSRAICGLACDACHSPHLAKVIAAIKAERPITFILPAFPGKSPNPSKVLGHLPDMAEQLALVFLEGLCEQIQKIYRSGAKIILCSDGRVFNDLVGIGELDLTRYQQELAKMVDDLKIQHISIFNLDELCVGRDVAHARRELMEMFANSPEIFRSKVLRGSKEGSHPEDQASHRLFCGITRFLVEDKLFPGQTKSRAAIQREAKANAYELIHRSNAWSNLLAKRFPEAVRLSIHPQSCGSKKLGVRLIGTESFMTPWHGVAVKIDGDFVLLKRAQAEAMGAKLVFSQNGRASHFELSKNSLSVSKNLIHGVEK